MKAFDNFAFLIRSKVVEITFTCTIKAGEKLFADYGKDYSGGFIER